MTMTTNGSTSHPARRPVRTGTYIRGLHATVWQEALRRNSDRRPAVEAVAAT